MASRFLRLHCPLCPWHSEIYDMSKDRAWTDLMAWWGLHIKTHMSGPRVEYLESADA